MTRKPNLIMIMTDEMRGDCMGYAGHPDVKTPYLDTLAAQGIYYPNAYTACPSCIPARAALYTGLSQKHHGRVGYADGVDWNYPVTMAGELAKAGYYTQCIGKMHVHPLRSMMGFHHIELHDGHLHYYRRPETRYEEDQRVADDYYYWLQERKGPACDVTDSGMDCNSWMARPWPYEEALHPTNWTASRGIDFLRRRDRRMPFFLMLSFVRPHAPYDAPACYFDMYKDRELRQPLMGDWDRDELGKDGRVHNSYTGPEDPELIRQQQVGYYACITQVDYQIGRFLQALQLSCAGEENVILFTSDHGELLSDHKLIRKSYPYQGSIHIPMILHGPEHLIGNGGRECDSLVELRDVMPTLLNIAGVTPSAPLDGCSMLENGCTREYLHGEHTHGRDSNHFIVTKSDKYVWFSQSGREQYFRLDVDPGESQDRISFAEDQERISYLRSLLVGELEGREEGYSDGKRLIVGRKPQAVLSHIREE